MEGLVTLASLQAPVRSKGQTYNLQEIDAQLLVIANLLKYSRYGTREAFFKDADKWLDRRNRLQNVHQ
jgi:hypothetical protein